MEAQKQRMARYYDSKMKKESSRSGKPSLGKYFKTPRSPELELSDIRGRDHTKSPRY